MKICEINISKNRTEVSNGGKNKYLLLYVYSKSYIPALSAHSYHKAMLILDNNINKIKAGYYKAEIVFKLTLANTKPDQRLLDNM